MALVVGGVALATLGILRLRGAGFVAMPRAVALATIVGGAAVASSGVLLLFLEAEPAREAVPRATLTPIDDGRRAPRDAQRNRRDDDAPVKQPAREQTLAGRVVTSDDDPVAEVAVSLVSLLDEQKPSTVQTRTDADGTFRFDDVDVNPGSPYVVEVTFDEGSFATPVLRGASEDLEVVVAETTKRDDDLEITAASLAVVGDDDGLQAVHAVTVNNRGDRAFIGRLRLPLLRGAAAIQEGPGLERRRLELTDDAMISTSPILPGEHDLTYTYVSPMPAEGVAFEQNVVLPTERYELLAGGTLTATQLRGLRASGTVSLGPEGERKTYRRYVATTLDAGEVVGARIEVSSGSSIVKIIGGAAALTVAILVVLLPVLRRRRAT